MPTFTRQERLKSQKAIGRLFKGGHAFVAYPLRVVWLEATNGSGSPEPAIPTGVTVPDRSEPEPGTTRIAVSVSKRNFKTAVQRNLLKRRIREAYRLQKHDFYEKLGGRNIIFMVMYIAKEELPFSEIASGVRKMIRKFPADDLGSAPPGN